MKCYCGMTVPEGVLHYPANDPENGPAHKPSAEDPNPDTGYESPDRCWECGRYADSDVEVFKTRTVDMDPGDPEVGPQPDITEVSICPNCAK